VKDEREVERKREREREIESRLGYDLRYNYYNS
jgi:hypothetical protein